MSTEGPQLPPEEQQPRGEPRIGTDEWVASVEGRRGEHSPLRRLVERAPAPARLAVPLALAAAFPLVTDNDFFIRVGVNTLLFALLALGLNVVVGYAGLLDLGYVAFYGFGAYTYAVLSSGQFDVHLPTAVALPIVVVASALLGLLLGLPSRRLLGDYLAIVTLFFAQIFVVFVNSADALKIPGRDSTVDVTGGPNGVTSLDTFELFGFEATSVTAYFYIALGTFVVVVAALHFLSESRTGRAWRALREDPLAAEAMGMPVNRLKLLAFAFGAATAGLTGTIFAAVQLGVFPGNFDLPLLIMVYAMVILGGAGSLTGVVIGATLITVLSELLEQPQEARLVFYLAVLLGVIAIGRVWWRVAAVLAGTVAVGFVVHAIVDAVWDRGTRGTITGGGRLGDVLDSWLVLPSNPQTIGNVAFVILVVAAIAVVRLPGIRRLVALPPLLYLAAFVWENRLATEPSVTRLILLGALLVALMNVRPQGLLGTSRVEIV
jgi:ABC-type branched-subunit amino acid transport system permease subunit